MLRFFKASDFTCKCDRGDKCDAVGMDMETALKLDGLRLEYGKPIIITSGVRCEYQNNKVGGVPDSQHLIGKAIDIRVKSGVDMARLVQLAIKHQFVGIGVAKGFLHLDSRSGKLVIF